MHCTKCIYLQYDSLKIGFKPTHNLYNKYNNNIDERLNYIHYSSLKKYKSNFALIIVSKCQLVVE